MISRVRTGRADQHRLNRRAAGVRTAAGARVCGGVRVRIQNRVLCALCVSGEPMASRHRGHAHQTHDGSRAVATEAAHLPRARVLCAGGYRAERCGGRGGLLRGKRRLLGS